MTDITQLSEEERRALVFIEKEREFQNKIQLSNIALPLVRSSKPDYQFRIVANPETHILYLQVSHRGYLSTEELIVSSTPHLISNLIIRMIKSHTAKIDRKIAKGKLQEKITEIISQDNVDLLDPKYWVKQNQIKNLQEKPCAITAA